MTSWAEDKPFVDSEESMKGVVGSSVPTNTSATPAGRRVKGSALAASFDELPSHMELHDAVAGTPYDEAE